MAFLNVWPYKWLIGKKQKLETMYTLRKQTVNTENDEKQFIFIKTS